MEIEDKDESVMVIHEHADFNEEVIYANQVESLVVQKSLKVAYVEDE